MSQTYDFYSARAKESAAEAKAATLDNVRERALRSQATWKALADQARAVSPAREERGREGRRARDRIRVNRQLGADATAQPPLASLPEAGT